MATPINLKRRYSGTVERLAEALAFYLAAVRWLALLVLLVYATMSANIGGGQVVMPLDDAYIHFQYAHQIAVGQPYVYNPGLPPTSGATSFLYPYLLALGDLLGFRGLNLGLWAMGIGAAALAICGVAGLPDRAADGSRLAGADLRGRLRARRLDRVAFHERHGNWRGDPAHAADALRGAGSALPAERDRHDAAGADPPGRGAAGGDRGGDVLVRVLREQPVKAQRGLLARSVSRACGCGGANGCSC